MLADGTPSLSVLIPNYNHARYLPKALDAILAQSYSPFEIIIVDDCSTDDSVAVIEGYTKFASNVRLVRNEFNMGAAAIGNRLLSMAVGEYVYFAAADDEVLPGLFKRSMDLLAAHPRAGLCSALVQMMDEQGNDLGMYQSRIVSRKAVYLNPNQILALLRKHGGWMTGCTLFFQREALMNAGGFIEELGPFVDGFTQQVVALKQGACFIPEILARWRFTTTGYSISESKKVEQYFSQMARMDDLMRNRYSGLFPEKYRKQFLRECSYGAAVRTTQNLMAAQDLYFDRMRLVLRPSKFLDQAFLAIFRFVMQLPIYAALAYVFVRQRHITWEMLVRRLAWFVRGYRTRYSR